MKPKTSLKDIAKIVGVSIPLVSYVLSNKGKENRVSEKTAKRIREVAKELNYHPNWNARSLKTNKTRSIGVIVADISNPFFSNLARTIEDEAFSQDYTVIFGSSDEKVEKFNKVLDFLKMRQVDGFIIAAPEGSREIIADLAKAGIPFVLIDRFFNDLTTNYVTVDNFKASMQATNYLLGKGNKKIGAVLYNSSLHHYKERHQGYVEALKKAGLTVDAELIKRINHGSLKADMKRVVKELVQDAGVDAIYFHTNTLAEEGLTQMLGLDRKILKKVDVVVFDQNSSYNFLEDPIPYLHQPIKEIGQKALRILIEQIQEPAQELQQISFDTSLESSSLEP
ncbi:transcriptional regulator, LacI family [Arenibacter palladensis]|jgi:LacI family transcriptional regulator|uniref:Transcriptional regulator, LacI family n=1 Tax=Arenibacter palladensis TaxID=237373 RepID=A0A1M4T8Z7_9FLAO|nr:LacI family DNA-binding transcriptional regulator [Arenibacter palladensis]SHE40844.1 transcriptional regulator, LacI family [Arenibacter palladensis]|tara:strand:+ start:1275 stop:2288 length:1014 start_codon:yes stop_codon:yes gene_type:complete